MLYRRRRPTMRAKSQYRLAKKAVQNELKKQVEVKKFYTNGNLSVDTDGSLAIPLEGIGLGTGSDDRIGNRINMLSQGILLNMSNGDANNTVRVLCLETYENYAPTTATGLFNTVTQPFVGNILAQVNRQIVKRVLYDRRVNLNPNWQGATKFAYRKGYVKFGKTGKQVQYIDGTPEPSKGHVYWVFVSDSAITPHVRLQYSIETRYTDM